MKNPLRFRSGFTLIELLVVIAIIAILAAVISVSAGAAINAAKRTRAANSCTQIQTAVVNYFTEYGVYPVPSNVTSDTQATYKDTDATDWQPLAYALCGNQNASSPTTTPGASGTVANTRNIPFLTPKKSEVDTKGIPFNPFTTSAAPHYFDIAMDADYNGVLASTAPDFTLWKSPTPNSAAPTVNLTQGVALWACCDPSFVTQPAQSTTPTLWVHTY